MTAKPHARGKRRPWVPRETSTRGRHPDDREDDALKPWLRGIGHAVLVLVALAVAVAVGLLMAAGAPLGR